MSIQTSRARLIKFPMIGRPPVAFPHIENTAQYIGLSQRKPIYDTTLPLPTLTFEGTVKVDGANCAIVKTRHNFDSNTANEKPLYEQHFQSRQKILAPNNDFHGFATHMTENQPIVTKMFGDIVESLIKAKSWSQDDVDAIESIAIFGEWCGGNIQKNIALSQLQKMFIIFAVKIQYTKILPSSISSDTTEWIDMAHLHHIHHNEVRIYNNMQFDTFDVTIDFSSEASKEAGLKKMNDLTESVRIECPVAKALGVTGKMRNGEGIVWKTVGIEKPLRLDAYMGPKCWVKTGAKTLPTRNDEVMRHTKTGW